MPKNETLYFRIAKNNTKLANDLYKIIKSKIKNLSKISTSSFKEAFHSQFTSPECRVLLLTHLFEKKPTFYSKVEYIQHDPSRLNIFLDIATKNGSKYFQIYQTTPTQIKPLKLNVTSRNELRAWQPWANKYTLLTRALTSGNAQSQKAAALIGQMSTALYALSDMLTTNIRANDPERFYYDTTDRDFTFEMEEDLSRPLGDLQMHQNKFHIHLQHMRYELAKYEPILNKLGIDLTNLNRELINVRDATSEFITKTFYSKDEEESELYFIHQRTIKLLDEVQNVALDVDKLDINDPAIYSLRRLENIPDFVDYNPAKLTRHRTMAGDNTSSTIELIKKLKNRQP